MSYSNYNQGGYGQQTPYDNYSGGYDTYRQGGASYNHDVEMQPLTHPGGTSIPPSYASHDPNAILNSCAAIDTSITSLESRLSELRAQQSRYLSSGTTDAGPVDALSADILTSYRGLTARVTKLKQDPASGQPRNVAQVGRVDRRLKGAINEFQKVESEFRREVREMQARQYRIVRPEASEEEVRAACEEPDQRVFQQALLNSDRRGQSQSALRAVSQRHDEIQKIERTMVELAQLFQDLEAAVVQQEPLVANIEEQAEVVKEDVTKANVELGGAVTSARAARRKKWWCLGISILILLVIAIIIVIWYFTTH